MVPLSSLLLLLLPALAQPAPAATPAAGTSPSATPAPAAPADAAQASPLEVSADLRGDYLAGEAIVVNLTLVNKGAAPLTVPDLSARPWKVRFKLTLPNGQSQTRFTTPPATEPTTTWTIPPRGQKRVALEIPSGAALGAGAYTLAVEVDLGDRVEALPSRAVSVAPPKVLAGQIQSDPLVLERSGFQVLWLHQASAGVDLYLTDASAKEPARAPLTRFLLHLDKAVDARLTAGRPGGADDRFVFWPEGPNALRYVRLQAGAVDGEPRKVTLPWPSAELLGSGATDTKGGLHVPVWVPGPKGGAGELRLASIDERGGLQLRKLLSLPARPDGLQTTVDPAGGVHVLVPRGDRLDLYTLRPDYGPDLPVPGERVWTAGTGAVFVSARFGPLPTSDTQAGGLGVIVVWTQGGAVQAQWFSLAARPLQRLQGTPLPAGHTLLDALASGGTPPALLIRDPEGGVRYQEGINTTKLPALPTTWRLVRDVAGRPALLAVGEDKALKVTMITPTPTPTR